MIITLFKTLLLPPTLQIVLFLVSGLCWWRWRYFSRGCLLLAIFSLWAMSTPFVGSKMHQWLEAPYVHANRDNTLLFSDSEFVATFDAIVVLGGGRQYDTPEYGGDTVSEPSLARLRYAGLLSRQYSLPVITSGGRVFAFEQRSEAALAANFLQQELAVATVWQEGNSRNTWQNAQLTSQLLQQRQLRKVLLVTHAYHMRRATYAFDQAGVEYLAMPMGFISNQASGRRLRDWLPRVRALRWSSIAIHEYLGLGFYYFKAMRV